MLFLKLQLIFKVFFYEKCKVPSYWNFEIGVENGSTLPIYIILGFQQKDRLETLYLPNTFFRSPVINEQCNMGKEKKPDVASKCDLRIGSYSQVYEDIVFSFRHLY